MTPTEHTHSTDEPTEIDEQTLRTHIEDWKWSISEIADKFDLSEADVRRAIHAYDINYSPYSTGNAAGGSAKTLWEMDPDDWPPDNTDDNEDTDDSSNEDPTASHDTSAHQQPALTQFGGSA